MKRVGTIDLDTSEVMDYALVAMQRKIPNGFISGWIAMAQDALSKMAKEIKSLDDFRVRDALLARLDFENYIQVVQVDIAKDLGMHKENVNRSIKRLLELGILLEGPKIGRSRTYRLNPNYGWKGSGKNHQKAIKAHDKAIAAGLKIHEGGRTTTRTHRGTD